MPTPPVLFLIFNRPELTHTVFQEIRKARPQQLYIAADGPRPGKPGESEKCERARTFASAIDWDCEVYTLFREMNLGCEIAVSQAITWFFERVESGIVLEDDCLPDPSFFPFCEELLVRYQTSNQVGVITGNNFQWNRKVGNSSYYFSKFPHCWGWASWRRAWILYDHSMSKSGRSDEEIIAKFGHIPHEVAYWKKIFNSLRDRSLNTWDYRWVRSVWESGLLTATPQVNLVTNIGIGADASHTKDEHVVPKSSSIAIPLVHPERIQQEITADARVARSLFGLSLQTRIKHRLNRLIMEWRRTIKGST